jgi:hypothetical protein
VVAAALAAGPAVVAAAAAAEADVAAVAVAGTSCERGGGGAAWGAAGWAAAVGWLPGGPTVEVLEEPAQGLCGVAAMRTCGAKEAFPRSGRGRQRRRRGRIVPVVSGVRWRLARATSAGPPAGPSLFIPLYYRFSQRSLSHVGPGHSYGPYKANIVTINCI